MNPDRKPAFRQVAPGISVREGFKVSYAHPTDCFILSNSEDTASFSHGESLTVFSSEEKANTFIEKVGLTGAVIKHYGWDELVDQFGDRFGDCAIDPTGETGFCGAAPLRKGI